MGTEGGASRGGERWRDRAPSCRGPRLPRRDEGGGGGGGRGRRKEKYGGADVIPRCFQGGGRGQAACVLH
jgi:hypothetical protein